MAVPPRLELGTIGLEIRIMRAASDFVPHLSVPEPRVINTHAKVFVFEGWDYAGIRAGGKSEKLTKELLKSYRSALTSAALGFQEITKKTTKAHWPAQCPSFR